MESNIEKESNIEVFMNFLRLETGWSTFAENLYKRSHGTTISEDEQSKIISILQQAQEMEDREQERIG